MTSVRRTEEKLGEEQEDPSLFMGYGLEYVRINNGVIYAAYDLKKTQPAYTVMINLSIIQ